MKDKYIKLSVGWCRKVRDLEDLWTLHQEGKRRIVVVRHLSTQVLNASFVAHWSYAMLRAKLPSLYVLETPPPTIWQKIRNLFKKK